MRNFLKRSGHGTSSDSATSPPPSAQDHIAADREPESEIGSHSGRPRPSSSDPSPTGDVGKPNNSGTDGTETQDGGQISGEAEGNIQKKRKNWWPIPNIFHPKRDKKSHYWNPFHPKRDKVRPKQVNERGTIKKEVAVKVQVKPNKDMRGSTCSEGGDDFGSKSGKHGADTRKYLDVGGANAKTPNKLKRRCSPSPAGTRDSIIRAGNQPVGKGDNLAESTYVKPDPGSVTRIPYDAPRSHVSVGKQPVAQAKERGSCSSSSKESLGVEMDTTLKNMLDSVPQCRGSTERPPINYLAEDMLQHDADRSTRRDNSVYYATPGGGAHGVLPSPRTGNVLRGDIATSIRSLPQIPCFRGSLEGVSNTEEVNTSIPPHTSINTPPNMTLNSSHRRHSISNPNTDDTCPPIPERNPNRLNHAGRIAKNEEEDVPPVPAMPPLLVSTHRRCHINQLNTSQDTADATRNVGPAFPSSSGITRTLSGSSANFSYPQRSRYSMGDVEGTKKEGDGMGVGERGVRQEGGGKKVWNRNLGCEDGRRKSMGVEYEGRGSPVWYSGLGFEDGRGRSMGEGVRRQDDGAWYHYSPPRHMFQPTTPKRFESIDCTCECTCEAESHRTSNATSLTSDSANEKAGPSNPPPNKTKPKKREMIDLSPGKFLRNINQKTDENDTETDEGDWGDIEDE